MTTSKTPSDKPSLTDTVVTDAIVEIPIGDVTIREAANLATDGKQFYIATMPQVLSRFPSITPDSYWELSVAEHAALVDWEE